MVDKRSWANDRLLVRFTVAHNKPSLVYMRTRPGLDCQRRCQSSFISLWGKQTIWLAVINMFDFHMVADRCLERYSLSSSDTIASRDQLYWVRRHEIPFLCVSREGSDWLNTNSDLLQARTGTATVTPARTAALTRRNCPGEALRPG